MASSASKFPPVLFVKWASARKPVPKVGSGSVDAIMSASVRGRAKGASGSAWVTAKTEYPEQIFVNGK